MKMIIVRLSEMRVDQYKGVAESTQSHNIIVRAFRHLTNAPLTPHSASGAFISHHTQV